MSTRLGRWHILASLRRFANTHRLHGEQEDALVAALATLVGVDYNQILDSRLLQLLSPEEVGALASQGVRFELHTHRHRTPSNRSLFLQEITDNRERLRALGVDEARHFCYPSGVHRDEMLPWLSESGIRSATTTDPGMATVRSEPLLLPRLVDTSVMSSIEFEGWLSGISTFLLRKSLGNAILAPLRRANKP